MPAGQGKDAEMFAAAVEQGTPPGFPVHDGLARDLEIVAMLRSRGAAYAPHPDAKARAKQRLMDVLAEQAVPTDGVTRPAAAPSIAELTAPLARILEPPFPGRPGRTGGGSARATVDDAVTARIAAVVELPDAVAEPEPATDAGPVARPGRRGGRHTMPNRPAQPRGSRRPSTGGLRRRTVLVGSAALVMMVALAAVGVFASRDALPGDNLYALKRAAESAGLALTFDDDAKARRHLDIATMRIDEMEQLVARGPQSSTDPELYRSALGDFDSAAGQGSRMLLASGDITDTAALAELRSWASAQSARLSDLRPALPVPAAEGADSALRMLERLVNRTDALEERSSCTEVTSGAVDDLGPIPQQGTCAPRPQSPADAGSVGPEGNVGPGTDSENPAGRNGVGGPDATVNGGTQGAEGLPGLLPGIGPNGLPLGGPAPSTAQDPSATSGTTAGEGGQAGGADKRLLPPITLPPLMPGMSGITIG